MKQHLTLLFLWIFWLIAAPGHILCTADEPAAQPPGKEEANEALGEYVDFKASGVKIRQPEGFEKEDAFEGFGQQETQSSILALGIAGPYSKLSAGFTKENMKARGWTLLSKEEMKVGDRPAVLIHFQQPAGGKVFLKWSLISGDDDRTTMVTATFPKESEKELSPRLKAAVLSTRPTGAVSDPAAELPFALAPSKKLKVARAISGTLALSKDGELPVEAPEDPMFIVAYLLGKAAIADRQDFAERRLKGTALTKELKVTSTKEIKIAGLQGYESLATAQEAKSGTPLTIYQVMLFDEGAYILVQGLVGTELEDEYLPEFKSLARSFKKKDGPTKE